MTALGKTDKEARARSVLGAREVIKGRSPTASTRAVHHARSPGVRLRKVRLRKIRLRG